MPDLPHQIVEQIPHLRRFSVALLRDRTKADDLVQDTIVRALVKSDSFTEGTNLRAWLFTIMRNLFVSQGRRYSARPMLQVVDSDTTQVSVPASQTDVLSLKELEQAVALLPEAQRITLLLIGLEGCSYEEAAEITGVPVGTVRSRLSRAREALRRNLGAETGIPGDGQERKEANASSQ